MGTSTPGTSSSRGFTLVELAVVLFVLGLVLWVALPRLAHVGEPDRDTVFRALSAGSEAAYDLSLFEKRETRLVLHPADGTYEFVHPDRPAEEKRALEFGSRLSVTGIRIEGGTARSISPRRSGISPADGSRRRGSSSGTTGAGTPPPNGPSASARSTAR